MRNRQKDMMFDYFIQGMDSKMQATLNMMYFNSCRIDEENHRREMEEMKKEIVEEVLARIAVKVDTGEVVQEMKEFNKELEKLEKFAGGGH